MMGFLSEVDMASLYRIAAIALVIAGLLPAPARGQADPLAEAVARAHREHPVALASLGLVLMEAETGRIRFASGEAGPMLPASLQKLLTSAIAWQRLGPDWRFRTALVSAAPREGDRLAGDLVLVGDADPTLTASDLGAMARSLRARGISRVDGLGLDGTRLATPSFEPGWVVEDLEEGYGAPVGALILEANVATLSGQVVPLKDPAGAAGKALRQALGSGGVQVMGSDHEGSAPRGGRAWAWHDSAPLREILIRMNKESYNLAAEAIFRHLGSETSALSAPSASQAVVEQLGQWGIASADLRVADGSGLSRYDLVAPRALAQVLFHMHHGPAAAAFEATLPVAGVDGTLRRRFVGSPLAGRLHAKTGTMSGVCGLAGYLAEGDRRYVLVLMANGFTGPVRTVQPLLDAIVAGWDQVLRNERDPLADPRRAAKDVP